MTKTKSGDMKTVELAGDHKVTGRWHPDKAVITFYPDVTYSMHPECFEEHGDLFVEVEPDKPEPEPEAPEETAPEAPQEPESSEGNEPEEPEESEGSDETGDGAGDGSENSEDTGPAPTEGEGEGTEPEAPEGDDEPVDVDLPSVLDELTVPLLREVARDNDVSYSGLNKEDLIQALYDAVDSDLLEATARDLLDENSD